jgi:hypothetical protein
MNFLSGTWWPAKYYFSIVETSCNLKLFLEKYTIDKLFDDFNLVSTYLMHVWILYLKYWKRQFRFLSTQLLFEIRGSQLRSHLSAPCLRGGVMARSSYV